MSRSTVRALAAGAIAVQVVFVVAWIVAGALDPGYSHAREGVSALGGRDAEHPWIVNTAIFLFGLSFVALAVALRAVLPGRRARAVTVALFAVTGALTAAVAFLPVDCSFAQQSCEDAWRAGELSWQTDAHIWISLVGPILITALPFAVALALRPGPVSTASLGIGAFALVVLLVSLGLTFADVGDDYGVGQRIGLFLVHGWIVIVAGGVLWATRRPPRPGRLVPLRPRDFVAGEWRGEGELVLRPLWLWRRFSKPFEARRRTTWISDRVFRMDDESVFGDGRAQRRTMYCEFVTDEVLRVTAADLPDDVEMRFEADGYRVAPWRMTFPLGPLPLLVRCRDDSFIEPDGTFANVTEVETVIFRVPLARVTFRVRPVEQEDGEQRPVAVAAG